MDVVAMLREAKALTPEITAELTGIVQTADPAAAAEVWCKFLALGKGRGSKDSPDHVPGILGERDFDAWFCADAQKPLRDVLLDKMRQYARSCGPGQFSADAKRWCEEITSNR